MDLDKQITATFLDATYIGREGTGFDKGIRYRLRAVRSKNGLVKIRLDKPKGDAVTYLDDIDFEMSWMDVKSFGSGGW